jgi:SAM-dependent methyltransferase
MHSAQQPFRGLHALTPAAMWARYNELVATRADVRVIACLLGEARLPEWLHSIAVCSDPVLGAMVPPLPPEHLRRIAGEHEPELFLWTGYLDIAAVLDRYAVHAAHEVANPRILDFGCGCGRLIRFLTAAHDSADVHAIDVNPEAVDWCREHVTGIQTACSGAHPPLPYEPASFDLVYSISVFSHLSETAGATWRQELARVTAPGGIIVLTTHGYQALGTIEQSQEYGGWRHLPATTIRSTRNAMKTDGIVFLPYDPATLARAGTGADYGLTFIDLDYAQRRWTDASLEVVEVRPGGLRGWQDIVVLTRR